MVYYILMWISLRNKLRKNIPWAWRPCADLQVSTDLWVGRSTFLCMDFYALNVSLSECDLASLEWDTGSSEWDLARSHYGERLECDSAYFDQWKFRLRVVLIFNYLSYENIYPLLTLIHTFIHIHIQGVPKKTQFWLWRPISQVYKNLWGKEGPVLKTTCSQLSFGPIKQVNLVPVSHRKSNFKRLTWTKTEPTLKDAHFSQKSQLIDRIEV